MSKSLNELRDDLATKALIKWIDPSDKIDFLEGQKKFESCVDFVTRFVLDSATDIVFERIVEAAKDAEHIIYPCPGCEACGANAAVKWLTENKDRILRGEL